VSEGRWGSLNLAARPGQPETALVRNWERALDALHPSFGAGDVAVMHQVHGAGVVEVTKPAGVLRVVGEADASFTREPGVVLAVRTADCVPVLLAGRGAVAVIHAGWRGIVAGVVDALLVALAEEPVSLTAAVGPCISGPAYEVGDEVVDGLLAAGVPAEAWSVDPSVASSNKPHVDLGAAVRHQLLAAGVSDVHRVERCTFSEPELHSWRRDGAASGRQAGLIAMVAP